MHFCALLYGDVAGQLGIYHYCHPARSFLIAKRLPFLPSPVCEFSVFPTAHYHWLLWILLSCSLILIIKGFRDFRFATILLVHPVVKKTSPGKYWFFHPIAATSTYNSFTWGVTIMCLLTQNYMPRMLFLFISTPDLE